jgi:acetyl esterase/lipase
MKLPRAVDLLNATVPGGGFLVTRNIPYGPSPRQMMDIYRPAQVGAPAPVVVWFYGGGWQSGERRDYRFVAANLARAGMVVAVPDYRLYPEVQFPSFIEDGAQAVAQMRRMARTCGGNPANIFVIGHSAGAYIAAMLAIAPAYLAAAGMTRGDLSGAVGIAGPYDFLPLTGADIKLVFGPANDDLRRTQPIFHVDGRNAPLLLLHGERDTTCYPRNALALAARVRVAQGRARVQTWPGVGHIGAVLGFSGLFRRCSPVLADTLRFVRGAWDDEAAPAIPADG